MAALELAVAGHARLMTRPSSAETISTVPDQFSGVSVQSMRRLVRLRHAHEAAAAQGGLAARAITEAQSRVTTALRKSYSCR